MKKLILPTLRTFLIGCFVLGLILFLPAWTFNYWQAWIFIFVFDFTANFIGIYLSIKDPALLERRKNVGPAAEQNLAQKIIMSLAYISIFGLLIFCSFAYRFGWGQVPVYIALLGDALVIFGLLLNLAVFRENSFGASTVQVMEDQKVISSGPYAVIRHPMYVGVFVMMAGVPLALGTWIGLAVLLIALPVLVWRILDEEKLLLKDLPGYAEYTQKVKYRLIPFIW
jgi:protein-S-isoprenylcysteine O-methyltransferase Ste14